MFTKKPDREPSAFDLPRSAPPPLQALQSQQATSPTPVRSVAKSTPSQIGADLTIIGNLVSKGEVHVDGEIQGDLHAQHITIGESAQITGSIVADEVIVRGTVQGSLRGRRVVLQSSSRVEGDVYHNQLGIEQGAYFEGKSRRVDDPTGGAAVPTHPLRNGSAHDHESEAAPAT